MEERGLRKGMSMFKKRLLLIRLIYHSTAPYIYERPYYHISAHPASTLLNLPDLILESSPLSFHISYQRVKPKVTDILKVCRRVLQLLLHLRAFRNGPLTRNFEYRKPNRAVVGEELIPFLAGQEFINVSRAGVTNDASEPQVVIGRRVEDFGDDSRKVLALPRSATVTFPKLGIRQPLQTSDVVFLGDGVDQGVRH